jgi:hypothetical protein
LDFSDDLEAKAQTVPKAVAIGDLGLLWPLASTKAPPARHDTALTQKVPVENSSNSIGDTSREKSLGFSGCREHRRNLWCTKLDVGLV